MTTDRIHDDVRDYYRTAANTGATGAESGEMTAPNDDWI